MIAATNFLGWSIDTFAHSTHVGQVFMNGFGRLIDDAQLHPMRGGRFDPAQVEQPESHRFKHALVASHAVVALIDAGPQIDLAPLHRIRASIIIARRERMAALDDQAFVRKAVAANAAGKKEGGAGGRCGGCGGRFFGDEYFVRELFFGEFFGVREGVFEGGIKKRVVVVDGYQWRRSYFIGGDRIGDACN